MVEQARPVRRARPEHPGQVPGHRRRARAIEEATFRGININGTVGFTVAQALAVAEAVERGLDRRGRGRRHDVGSMTPVATIMVGRLDDWMKVLVERDNIALHPDAANWAGVAVFKRAYGIFRERGYRSRLLAAAYRHRLHWTELVGRRRRPDHALLLAGPLQRAAGSTPSPRMDEPVDPRARRRPATADPRLPPGLRAGRPDARRVRALRGDARGPCAASSRRTTTSRASIRDLVLPNPDVKPG